MTTRKETTGSEWSTPPQPGDLLEARVVTRGWESVTRRGYEGPNIVPGDRGTVIAVMRAFRSGGTYRVWLFMHERIVLTSMVLKNAHLNWDRLARPTV